MTAPTITPTTTPATTHIADLTAAFAAQVEAMLHGDQPVGTILLPFAPRPQATVTLLGGNYGAHGGYIHRRAVRALLDEPDATPAIFERDGHDVEAMAKAVLLELGYQPAHTVALAPAPLPQGLRAVKAGTCRGLSLPYYRSRSVIRPKGFTFGYSR